MRFATTGCPLVSMRSNNSRIALAPISPPCTLMVVSGGDIWVAAEKSPNPTTDMSSGMR